MDERTLKQRVMSNSVDVFITLAVVTLFVYLSFQIFQPFVSVLLWATIMAIGLQPAFRWLRGKVGGKSGIAAALIAVIGLIILLWPAGIVVESVLDTVGPLATKLQQDELVIPPPDASVKAWPIVGGWIYENWMHASTDLADTALHFAPQLQSVAAFLLQTGAGLASGILQFALSILIAAVILTYTEPLSNACFQIANRIGGDRGKTLLSMAGATILNVCRGVLGVAIIQGGLATIGIFAVGFPLAGIVAALAVASSIIQVPLLVIVPTIIYVWAVEPTLTAVLYTAYMVPVLLSDNLLKPILMARGLETPMIIILIGVIGGTISSGLLGLFIGPVVLAVFHKMVTVWVSSMDSAEEPAAGTASGEKS
ncbi:MAG: AI-2E family transporter [Pseudomonadota bacterium]